MSAFLAKLLVAGAFTVLTWVGAAAAHHPIPWVLAAGLSLITVFGSLPILDRLTGLRRRAWRG